MEKLTIEELKNLSAQQIKELWLDGLKSASINWTEWLELIEAVERLNFEKEYEPYTKTYWLKSKEQDAKDNRLYVEITPKKSEKLLPEYIKWIHNLKYTDAALSAGGLASYFNHEGFKKLTSKHVQKNEYMVKYTAINEVIFPKESIYPFQMSNNGGLVFIDIKSNIRVFSTYTNTFEIIGNINDYIMYNLRLVLNELLGKFDYAQKNGLLSIYNLNFVEVD
jgi:hypothetical protein